MVSHAENTFDNPNRLEVTFKKELFEAWVFIIFASVPLLVDVYMTSQDGGLVVGDLCYYNTLMRMHRDYVTTPHEYHIDANGAMIPSSGQQMIMSFDTECTFQMAF